MQLTQQKDVQNKTHLTQEDSVPADQKGVKERPDSSSKPPESSVEVTHQMLKHALNPLSIRINLQIQDVGSINQYLLQRGHPTLQKFIAGNIQRPTLEALYAWDLTPIKDKSAVLGSMDGHV